MRGCQVGPEWRDSLATDWWQWTARVAPQVDWLPLPNRGSSIVRLARELGLSGLILSGGDDLGAYPLRDETERALLDWTRSERLPVLGICRGMQMMCSYSGGLLGPSSDEHHGRNHRLRWLQSGEHWEVNSFHRTQIRGLPSDYEALAVAEDGSVEAMQHRELPWLAILWHPERANPHPQLHDQILLDFIERCGHPPRKPGSVYWFTGLAGAGKTTLARAFLGRLRERGIHAIFLDGDRLRETIAEDAGYTRDERLRAALRYSRLCGLLAEQGQPVVCATISMFHQVRAWNRQHLQGYREVYVRALPEVLAQRDQKGLYSQEHENVAGKDLTVELPESPDWTLDNNGERTPDQMIAPLLEGL